MALFDQIYEASYQGVKFPCLKTKTKGGRKDIKHEFPNSNNQSIEDLGLKPRSYEITAIITGEDYFNRRDKLLQVLENGELGVLIHPFYGRIEKVKARSFILDENLTRLGDTPIVIFFDVSDSDGLPVKTVNTVSLVSQQATVVQTNVQADVTDKFKVTPSFRGNFQSAQTKLQSVVDTVRSNAKSFSATSTQINGFSQLVNDFEDNIPALIQNPDRLASGLNEIFTTLPDLYTSAEDKVATLSQFTSFGVDDVIVAENTAARIERELNRNILNNTVRTLALSENYVAAAQIEFDTVDEIDTVADELELAFQTIKQDSPV